MHPVLKEALFDNWDTIVSNLNFELILQKFMWAFSPDEYESVILESGETARCEQLLLVLSQKGDALFYELIKLLKVNTGEFKASPKVHSEVFHKIIKHIKQAYGIQSIKNSKCYGLSEPDVFFVNRFSSQSEKIAFPFSLWLEAKEDTNFDKRAQICDSFCWSLMRENNNVRCVVFHKLISGKLNTSHRVNSLFFDLFFWITNKPGTLLGFGELEECFSVSQMSLINWLRRLVSKLKVVLVMGFLDYQEGDVQVLDALIHAGVSTLVYCDHDASEKIVDDVSKFGVVVESLPVPEMTDNENPAESKTTQISESSSITASMSQLLSPLNNCEAVFKELPHNIQTLVNHCAILEDRVLSMKTLKHLWRYFCRDQTADHMEVHSVLDVLINKRIVTHFLDSYFLAPSMKRYIRSQIGQVAWKLLHQNFLQAYLEKFKNWLNVPESDSYFHRYLIHHLIEAGGKSEIVNLLSNLEWLLHRCRCDLLKQLPFDVQLLLSVKDEDKDSLYSFLRIFDLLIQLNPGTNYKMFLTYTISSLCNKIGASSIFTKLFTSLSKVVTRGFWFLPLHDSIIPKLTCKIRQIRCISTDVKVIFSNSKIILLASQTELILLNRVDLTFARSVKFSTEFRIVLVTVIKDAEVNIVTQNSDLWQCDFSTGSVELVTNLYPSCKVIQAYSMFENSLVVTVHNNGVLKIWCSVSYELSAATSLTNNGGNFSTPDAITVSCACSEEEIIRIAVVCTGRESNSCYVLDYDCETMDLIKVATIALSSDIESGYISKSGDIIVSTTTDASIEIYSIETETFIRTPGVSSNLRAMTRSGLYVFVDDSGTLDLCTLEGETQITPVLSQKLEVGAISQCYVADDVDDLIVVSMASNSERSQRSLSILALQSLLYSSFTDSRIVKSKEAQSANNQVFLNGDGSLIYSILAHRIICEATDTLNPVQVYSLPANVTSFCYTEAVFGGLVCLFFDTNVFILLKCPSFDRLFDSTDTKAYKAAPFFCFFSEHLLYFVFETFIEIWDCHLLKNLIINIPVEMPISDAAISGHCLQLLHRNGMVRSINLQDMTWDLTRFNSSSLENVWMRLFFLYVPVLKDWLIGYVSENFLLFTGTVNSTGSPKFDLGFSSNDYNPLSVQVAGNGKLCVILDDSTKQQIILKVYDFKDSVYKQSYTLLYEDNTYAQYCRTNPASICIAPDISKMLWVEEKTAYVALVSLDEHKVVKFNVSENITKAMFATQSMVFICCDDFTFHLCSLDMSENVQKVTNANSCHEAPVNKVDLYFEKQCSWIVSSDAKGCVCFWVARPDRCKLKLVHSQELTSPTKSSCSSFFDIASLDSKLIYASVSEDENLNIWIIDTKVLEIESFIQREAPSFACCLLICNESVQYLSNDYAISKYDYVTSTFVAKPQIPENLRQFRTMHRFLGTSGLIASSCPTSSKVLIWDSVSQGFCASLSSKLVNATYMATDELQGEADGERIMDIKVIPEFCLILVGFPKYLDVWHYNEEALLLHNEDASLSHSRDISFTSTLDNSTDTLTSPTNTSKKVARLDLLVTLKSIIVSDNHSLIAVIDSTAKYHLIELYNRKLFNRSGNARISHYEKFIK